MKNILLLCLLNLTLSAQKITTDNLTKYLYKHTADLNNVLQEKGWELADIKKGDSEHYSIATWSTSVPSVYFQLYEAPELTENYTVYQLVDKKEFLALKKELQLLPLESLGSKLKDNEIWECYSQPKKDLLIVFRTATSSSGTAYIIQTYALTSKMAYSIIFDK